MVVKKPDDMKRVVAQRLREERERLDKTLEDFAAVGELTATTQQRYETGDRTPDAAYLAELARALGVDLLYVLTGRREPKRGELSDAEATLLQRHRALPQQMQQHVESTALIAWLAYQDRKGYHLHFDAK